MRRTSQDISQFIQSLKIPSKTFDTYLDFDITLQQGDKKGITDFRLFTGYGDAFSYKGKAIVVLGETMVGKTTIVEKFHEEGSQILADDALLWFDPDGESGFEVYRSPFLDKLSPYDVSWDEIIETYAHHLANSPSVPLRLILHLTESPKQGFAQPNMDKILGYLTRNGTLYVGKFHKDVWAPTILQGVEFLQYSRGYNASSPDAKNKNINRTFEDIRCKLDRLL